MPHFTQPALLIALMLLIAIAGGYAGALFRLPRVVGYLAGGVLLHVLVAAFHEPTQAWHSPAEMIAAAADQLSGLKTLALGLIMFVMGSVFEAQHIARVAPRLLRLSAAKLVTVIVLVAPVCGLIAGLQGIGTQPTRRPSACCSASWASPRPPPPRSWCCANTKPRATTAMRFSR